MKRDTSEGWTVVIRGADGSEWIACDTTQQGNGYNLFLNTRAEARQWVRDYHQQVRHSSGARVARCYVTFKVK